MSTLDCINCLLKYQIKDHKVYICKCSELFASIQCDQCAKTQPIYFDEMESNSKTVKCCSCQNESIQSPCANCTSVGFRDQKKNFVQCKDCGYTTYYFQCQQCMIWFGVKEGQDTIDGKVIKCPLQCSTFQILQCTKCQSMKQYNNFTNDIKNQCDFCKTTFYKQICSQCKQVSSFTQKESNLKQKCRNKKCTNTTYLRAIKINNQESIQGEMLQPLLIEPIPKKKTVVVAPPQQTQQIQQSKFLEQVNLLDFNKAEEKVVAFSKIITCKKCNNSKDVVMVFPCGHKALCYQCQDSQTQCFECGELIANRIINAFNRDFEQEILERIKYEKIEV